MAFSLTIQADNFASFKAQIIALEEMFATEVVAADPVMPELRGATAEEAAARDIPGVKSKTGTIAKKADPKPEPQPEAETPASEQATEQTAEGPKAEVESTALVCPPRPENYDPKNNDSDPATKAFSDFIAEQVIPRVTDVVKKHGKPFAQEIIARFGAEKATLVSNDKMAMMLKQLDEALEG